MPSSDAHLQVDVHEKHIWSSAEYVHNQFLEGKDKAFYLAPDRINDAEVSKGTTAAQTADVTATQQQAVAQHSLWHR
jgi:hypothetical protein